MDSKTFINNFNSLIIHIKNLTNLIFYLFMRGFIEHLKRVLHADRGLLLFRVPGPFPF